METLFVQTESSTIMQMDVDALDDDGMATTAQRERFDERVAKGELRIVDAKSVKKIPNADGTGYLWVDKSVDADEFHAANRARGRSTPVNAARRGATPATRPARDDGPNTRHEAGDVGPGPRHDDVHGVKTPDAGSDAQARHEAAKQASAKPAAKHT